MRGDDVVDLVRVELAVGIHLSGVLIERRVMQLLAAQALGLRRMRQIGEHQRRGQHVDGVLLPAEPLVEQSGNHVRALGVEIVPHALAQQGPRVRRALEIRRIAEVPGEDRPDDGAQTQLVDGILLVDVVDAHLRGGRAPHHARAELAYPPQVVGHGVVTVLRVDLDVGEARLGLVAVIDQTEAQLVQHGIDVTPEGTIQRQQFLRRLEDAQRALHLTAGLQRHGDAFAPESDQMAVLPVLLFLVIVRRNALEQRFDAVLLVVADGGVVAVVHRKMFDLHAETARAAFGTAFLEESQQTVDVLGIRLGEQMRVTDSRCRHGAYRTCRFHRPQRCRYTKNR